MPGPVFGVDGVVDDRWIKPEPISLFAVIKGCFECGTATASAATTSTAAAASWAFALGFVVVLRSVDFALSESGFKFSRNQRVIFCSQVKFFFDPRGRGGGFGRCGVFSVERLLGFEGRDISGRGVKLMRDPCVGATLPHPDSDLVQMWSERSS